MIIHHQSFLYRLRLFDVKTDMRQLSYSIQSSTESCSERRQTYQTNTKGLPLNEGVTTKTFIHLGGVISQVGWRGIDIRNVLSNAVKNFLTLLTVWISAQYSIPIKFRIYRSCLLSTFLYGAESWRTKKHDLSRLSTFHATYPRNILRIVWPGACTMSTT